MTEQTTESEQEAGQNNISWGARVIYIAWRVIPQLLFIALCIVVVLFMASLNASKKEQLDKQKAAMQVEEKRAVNVVALEVQPRILHEAINLPGVVEAWTELSLMAKINGSIEEVLVSEGDQVKKGDILARIEPDDYQIALDIARANYRQAKADSERDRAMLKKKVIPVATLESSETRLQTARAELAKAKLQLSRCAIKAPGNAVIQALPAKVGLYVSVGDPLATLLELERVKAVVGIPESDVDAVRRVDQVALTIQALTHSGEQDLFWGQKHFLASAPDNNKFLYRLELALDNPEHRILPGMFVRANIIKQEAKNALSVPLFSVISRNDEHFVYINKNGVARKQLVRTGIIDTWHVQILEGLSPGDQVLVEGHRGVEEGQPIQVVKLLSGLSGDQP